MSGADQVNSLAQIANLDISISDRSLLADYNDSSASLTDLLTEQPATPAVPPTQVTTSPYTVPTDDDSTTASSSSSDSASSNSEESDDDFQEQPVTSFRHQESDSSRVSFGSAVTNLVTGSQQLKRINSATLKNNYPQDNYPTKAANARAMDISDNTVDSLDYGVPPTSIKPKKSALRNSTPGPIDFNAMGTQSPTDSLPPPPSAKNGTNGSGTPKRSKRSNRALTMVSAQYDFENKGYLDPVQQAMRDQDIDNSGNLDQFEVRSIVNDQLKNVRMAKKYRKVIAALLCLVMVLALSNFGTSWATAILSKDTVADGDTNTVQNKAGEVVGYQDTAFTVEMEDLDETEFEMRRQLVDRELSENIDHEDHAHRKLGKKNKNNKCNCDKIGYDHGKISEQDLRKLRRKCDGGNIVNVMTGWKDLNGKKRDAMVEQICGPGTVVQRRGKKKRNKKGTKVKEVDDVVTFRRKKKGGNKDASVTFSCKGGACYASGAGTLRRAGHPCNLARDYEGASECDSGLVCYDPDGNTYGPGTCTKLSRYAGPSQVCQVGFGVDACDAGYACYSTNGGRNGNGLNKKSQLRTGIVSTGLCDRVSTRAKAGEVCDVSYGANACGNGYRCLGVNGLEMRSSKALGYCAQVRSGGGGNNGGNGGNNGGNGGNNGGGTGAWYIDDSIQQCVTECNGGNNNGGWCRERKNWEDPYTTAKQCCESSQMAWMPKRDCVPGYNDWNNNGNGRNNNGGNGNNGWNNNGGNNNGNNGWNNNGNGGNNIGNGNNGWNNNGNGGNNNGGNNGGWSNVNGDGAGVDWANNGRGDGNNGNGNGNGNNGNNGGNNGNGWSNVNGDGAGTDWANNGRGDGNNGNGNNNGNNGWNNNGNNGGNNGNNGRNNNGNNGGNNGNGGVISGPSGTISYGSNNGY